MLKRQGSLLSSSSRREHTPPPPQSEKRRAKSVGCMAGIFRLLSKYQIHRRRKFLTFGKEQSEAAVIVLPLLKSKPSEATLLVSPISDKKKLIDQARVADDGGSGFGECVGRFSCELPTRSPALPQEIRRRPFNSLVNSMSTESMLPLASSSSSEEKRRTLLDALDKCDRDLKALKKIIQTVQFDEEEQVHILQEEDHCSTKIARPWVHVMASGAGAGAAVGSVATKRGMGFNINEKPEELTRSFLSNSNIYSKRHSTTTMRSTTMTTTMTTITAGRVPYQQKLAPRKKPVEDDVDLCFLNKVAKELLEARYKPAGSSLWSSNAMVESVDEVCGDIAWGEKREVRRIGLELQDFICRDLIEEFIRDSGFSCIYSLPFQACKRRIQF